MTTTTDLSYYFHMQYPYQQYYWQVVQPQVQPQYYYTYPSYAGTMQKEELYYPNNYVTPVQSNHNMTAKPHNIPPQYYVDHPEFGFLP